MKKITFFCEGVEDNDNSLDWQLFRILLRPLSRTLKSLHFTNGEEDGDNDLDILGMRSKSYYTRYIEGFKNKSKLNDVDDTIIAAFRDRDFDIEVKQTELHNLQILTKPNANPVLYCGERTTIENYLLDYQTFTDYVQNHLSSKKPNIKLYTRYKTVVSLRRPRNSCTSSHSSCFRCRSAFGDSTIIFEHQRW